MKKIITSAGLAALSFSTLQAAHVPAGVDTTKPWSISAALRGFYDDNYNTVPDGPSKLEAFGFEVTPSFSLNFPLDQSFIGLSYVYSLRWYEERPGRNQDETHQVNLRLDHAFSERYKVEFSDSFVVAQEPEIIDENISVPFRTEGDNIRNKAEIDFTIQMTRLLGLVLGYQNNYYNYEQNGVGSRSALLDRMEHLANIDLRWQALPKTIAVLGYAYGQTHYTSDDSLYVIPGLPDDFKPDDRDNELHRFYVGADQNFTSQLNGSIRAGVEHVIYDDADQDASTSPFADASLTYTYNPGSYLLVGARYSHQATDVTAPDPTDITGRDFTVDAESATFYTSISHKITPRLTASLIGLFQRTMFNGGAADSSDDDLITAGFNLTYKFNPHWSAETGYNFDKLDSEIRGRDYDRHRVYVGVRATY